MSSWQLSQLKFALGLGGMMSFYGIVSLTVWLMPGSSPMQTRIIIIALILLTLPFALLIGYLATRKSRKKEDAPAQPAGQAASTGSAAAAGTPNLNAPAGSYADITSGAEEVIQFLKTSNLGAVGKEAAYSLPWYIVAGTATSGKSALVINSNLNFQPLPSQRQADLAVVRPTRSVDWRVANDAVFLDTTGRYQTEGADADEWASLLETLRKYRSNRPLDGFLLIVNAKEILSSDERQIEEKTKVLRARLDEAIQRLKVRFPVYLIFTNADAIEGFSDSFSASKQEDKTLVWGSTIPLEKSDNAQSLFDSEYEILHDSVMKRRLVRLSAPFPPVRQLRIFNFPLHFGSARRKFGAFVNALFRPNPFSENPFLRGFYFTAAPQAKSRGGASSNGHAYFTERLFRDVILRDRDLVKTFQAQRQRPPIFAWFFTLLFSFIVFVLLVMSGVSLYLNRQLLDEASERGQRLITISRTTPVNNAGVFSKTDKETRDEINATENMRELLSRLDDYDRNGPPIYMRMGLYSGGEIFKKQLLVNYMSVVEQRFKKPTVARLEAELRKFAASQPVANPGKLTDKDEEVLGRNYDLLKAYLMLSGDYRDRAEASHIANTLRQFWVEEAKLPADLNLVAEAQLDFWAKQVDRDQFPRIQPDMKLVADARAKLQAFPAPNRYYKRKVTEISKQVDEKVGKTTVEGILARGGADDPGLLEGTYQVPGAYTKSGYNLMQVAFANAVTELSSDDWVMGETGKQAIASTTDAQKIRDMYYRDYADHWRNFVRSTNVRPFKDRDDAANALASFSSANSPMKVLLLQVAKDTNLSAPDSTSGLLNWLKSWFSSSKKTDTGGDTQPEKEFRPLFPFVTGKDNKVPVDAYQTIFAGLLKKFNTQVPSNEALRDVAQKMADEKDPLELRNASTDIQKQAGGFKDTASGQELLTLLTKPVDALRQLFGADPKTQITKTWSDQILPAAKDVEKGYPFEDGAAEADMTKLTAFLNPNDGKFTQFYKSRLQRFFEESNGQLKPVQGSEVQFSDDFVAYLNNVMNLQKALFGTSPTPKFQYEFGIKPVTGGLIQITLDGQKVSSDATGTIQGSFPGSGTDLGVLIELGSTSTTTVAGPAPASNSNSATKPADNGPGRKTWPGTWGLFRFVEDGHPVKQGDVYQLSYNVGGKSISATIKPTGGDLFDKNAFKSVKAPQTVLK